MMASEATKSRCYRSDKYRDDTVFQAINKKYLTLEEEEKKRNNEHLKRVVEESFIPLLKKNQLFNLLFRRIMYGGSYYKRTKYGKPREFDLVFILKLPIDYSKITIDTNHQNYGFVKIKIDLDEDSLTPKWKQHRQSLSAWLTSDNYLNQNKFRRWVESVFISAYNKYDRTGNGFECTSSGETYQIKQKKSGPAFTLIITTPEGSEIDVDLVPAFEFNKVLGDGYKKIGKNKKKRKNRQNGKSTSFDKTGAASTAPIHTNIRQQTQTNAMAGKSIYQQQRKKNNQIEISKIQSANYAMYKQREEKRRTYMVVAKPLPNEVNGDILWRLCFYEQEKEFLEGDVKPVIRMMKKFRDTKNWKSIASYYIENIFYHELENHKHHLNDYLRASKIYLFVEGLTKLEEALSQKKLPYFWHENHDLFAKIGDGELFGMHQNLKSTIAEISLGIKDDPWILAKNVLSPSEYSDLRKDFLEENMTNLHIRQA